MGTVGATPGPGSDKERERKKGGLAWWFRESKLGFLSASAASRRISGTRAESRGRPDDDGSSRTFRPIRRRRRRTGRGARAAFRFGLGLREIRIEPVRRRRIGAIRGARGRIGRHREKPGRLF